MPSALELLKSRRSVRRFEPTPVPRELLLSLVETATWAPSASNRQDWGFVVVTSTTLLHALAESVRQKWEQVFTAASASGLAEELRAYAGNFDWFAAAPALVVITCKKTEGYLESTLGKVASDVAGGKTSAAMAAQNLLLAAHALGLGSCCLTGPVAASEAIKKLLAIEARREIVCLVALGYASHVPEAPTRKALSEVVRIVDEDERGEPPRERYDETGRKASR